MDHYLKETVIAESFYKKVFLQHSLLTNDPY